MWNVWNIIQNMIEILIQNIWGSFHLNLIYEKKHSRIITSETSETSRDHYICDVKWLDTGSLAVLWMNRSVIDDKNYGKHTWKIFYRLQNTSYYSLCSPPEYQCHQVSFNIIIFIISSSVLNTIIHSGEVAFWKWK